MVLFRHRALLKAPVQVLVSTFGNILRSSLFPQLLHGVLGGRVRHDEHGDDDDVQGCHQWIQRRTDGCHREERTQAEPALYNCGQN